MNEVLIVGGTGFIGYWMRQTVPKCVDYGCLSRDEYNSLEWDKVTKWSHVVHLAPISPARVIAYCKKAEARLLYASSGIVYHRENNTPYRQDKVKGELMCRKSNLDFVIARLFTFFGTKLDDNKAVTAFIKAAEAGGPLHVWGDGETYRSYMHGYRMGKWMWAILLNGQSGEAYDVGDDTPITILEVAQRIAERYDPQPRIVIDGGVDPMPCYLPTDTEKTKALLTI